MTTLYGGIEAGGTRFVCALGSGPDNLRAQARFPTGSPAETLARAVDFFREGQARFGPLAAIGVGAFGPLDLHPDSPAYGRITATPKPGWAGADLLAPLRAAFGLPLALDTDVNAAALGEARWGSAQGLETLLYLTVGTGIGGGGLVRGRPLRGLIHPEMGHIRVPHDREADPFGGGCPFHGDCLEGLASGPAMRARWGQPAETLPDDHPAWELEAGYLALGVVNLICILSPQRVVLGGGVMQRAGLLPRIRRRVVELLSGYVQAPQILTGMDAYLVPPALGARAGVLAAIAIAERAAGLSPAPLRRVAAPEPARAPGAGGADR